MNKTYLLLLLALLACGESDIYKYHPENMPIYNKAIDNFFGIEFESTKDNTVIVYHSKELLESACRTENASGCYNIAIGRIMIHESLKEDCRLIVHEMLHAVLFERDDLGFHHHDADFFENERLICESL